MISLSSFSKRPFFPLFFVWIQVQRMQFLEREGDFFPHPSSQGPDWREREIPAPIPQGEVGNWGNTRSLDVVPFYAFRQRLGRFMKTQLKHLKMTSSEVVGDKHFKHNFSAF